MTQDIFNKFVEKYKHQFNTTTMFGVPISEIDDDALRACACHCGEMIEDQRKSAQKERDMFNLLRKTK